jgi:hypothetical protein
VFSNGPGLAGIAKGENWVVSIVMAKVVGERTVIVPVKPFACRIPTAGGRSKRTINPVKYWCANVVVTTAGLVVVIAAIIRIAG